MGENDNIYTEKTDTNDKAVERRILDASEELFCQNGFDGTSIRDITTKANCNVSAVNYHFGGKENLYLATFKLHLGQLKDTYIATVDKVMSQAEENITLENLLRSFSTAFIELLVGKRKTQRFITLMTREMLDPHLPMNLFYDEMMLPVQIVMQNALKKICPQISDKQSMLAMMSIVGQLIHIVRFTEFVERGGIKDIPFDINELVEHTVNFSAAGIRAGFQKTKC